MGEKISCTTGQGFPHCNLGFINSCFCCFFLFLFLLTTNTPWLSRPNLLVETVCESTLNLPKYLEESKKTHRIKLALFLLENICL